MAVESVMAEFKLPCLQKILFTVVVLMAILSSQKVNTYRIYGKKSIDTREITGAKYLQPPMKSSSTALYAAKKQKKAHPVVPEFSRVLNVGQIPERRPVLCKLLAKEKERAALALRFDIPEITYFSANVTISRRDQGSIVVEGDIEAHIKGGELMEPEILHGEFDTLLLDNSSGQEGGASFDEEMDYDDEVDKNGNIDLGEIASQYLSLELF